MSVNSRTAAHPASSAQYPRPAAQDLPDTSSVRLVRLWPWALFAVAFVAMYLPSFIDLFRGEWATEKNAHGPLVLIIASVYFVLRLRQLARAGELEYRPSPILATVLLLMSATAFIVGRSQSVLLLEVGSLITVLASVVALVYGRRTCRELWFAFFFMLFMIPLPASVVDTVTQPMKIAVSYASEFLMRHAGLPVARSGVIIYIGQYQLLVADACAGLNSLFTLEALGLLYLNLVTHHSVWRNASLGCLIVPISFIANTVRVITLSLITYYFGDAAGQGFLHGFSSLVLFLSALFLIISLDGFLRFIVIKFGGTEPGMSPGPVNRNVGSDRTDQPGWRSLMLAFRVRSALVWSAVLFGSAASAIALHPDDRQLPLSATLASTIPTRFGDWHEVPSPYIQASLSVGNTGERSTDQPYDDIMTRTYRDGHGNLVMLALAYARQQKQDVKIHLPEVCYRAQGFSLSDDYAATIPVGAGKIPARRMTAVNNGRFEGVSYWIRIGDHFPQGAIAMRYRIFLDGLTGKVDDGILVRASTIATDGHVTDETFDRQEAFLRALYDALDPETRRLIAAS